MSISGFVFVGCVFSSLASVSSLVLKLEWSVVEKRDLLNLGTELLKAWMASGSPELCCPNWELKFW